MSTTLEILLLFLAIAAVAILAWDLTRRLRERRASEREPDHSDDQEQNPARDPGPVELRLLRAGVPIGAATYAALSTVLALAVFLLAYSRLPGDSWFVAALTALVAAALPWIALGAWGRRRARRFEEKLVDGVDVMVSALSAGESLEQSLATAAEASSPHVAHELREVGDRLEVGMSMPRAVRRMAIGRDSEGVRLFTQTLVAQSGTGSELAPVLRSVARIMRDRLTMRLRLEAQMAGARLAAVVIAILPYLLLPVFLWRRPEWLSRLFADPWGIELLIIAVLLQIFGFIWLRRVMRIEVRS